jgi:hypothetical protein
VVKQWLQPVHICEYGVVVAGILLAVAGEFLLTVDDGFADFVLIRVGIDDTDCVRRMFLANNLRQVSLARSIAAT